MNRGDLKTGTRNEKIDRALGEMWQETCQKGASISFKVVTGSMSPLIEVGDTVRVSRVESSGIRTGDIIAFQDGQNVVVHRIIGKIRTNRQTGFRQGGDAWGPSAELEEQNIIGRVLSINKGGRDISLDTPRFMITNKILVWRGQIKDRLNRKQTGFPGVVLSETLKPVWRLSRKMFFWRL